MITATAYSSLLPFKYTYWAHPHASQSTCMWIIYYYYCFRLSAMVTISIRFFNHSSNPCKILNIFIDILFIELKGLNNISYLFTVFFTIFYLVKFKAICGLTKVKLNIMMMFSTHMDENRYCLAIYMNEQVLNTIFVSFLKQLYNNCFTISENRIVIFLNPLFSHYSTSFSTMHQQTWTIFSLRTHFLNTIIIFYNLFILENLIWTIWILQESWQLTTLWRLIPFRFLRPSWEQNGWEQPITRGISNKLNYVRSEFSSYFTICLVHAWFLFGFAKWFIWFFSNTF